MKGILSPGTIKSIGKSVVNQKIHGEKEYRFKYIMVTFWNNSVRISLDHTLLEIRVLQGFFTNTYNKPYPIGLSEWRCGKIDVWNAQLSIQYFFTHSPLTISVDATLQFLECTYKKCRFDPVPITINNYVNVRLHVPFIIRITIILFVYIVLVNEQWGILHYILYNSLGCHYGAVIQYL
jgi:hypothetical protein